MEIKPYKVHTRTVFDIETGRVLEDDFYYSTESQAKCGAAVVVAIVGAVIAGASAIYGANQSRYAFNTQQDSLLAQQAYNRSVNERNEAARQIQVQAAYGRNSYEQMKYGLMLQQLGMTGQYYGMLGAMAGNQFSLRQEVYEWQLATADWEANYRQQQADFLKEQGAKTRGLYGTETAKLLAHNRMMNAAAAVEIGVGSPIEVLGELASERQYASDIMGYNTGVDVYDKLMQKADVLNQKNKIGFDRSLADLEYGSTLLDLAYKTGVNQLNVQETTGLLGLARSDRTRIGAMSGIELTKYNLGQAYGQQTATNQAGYYGNAANYASGTGLALNLGSSVFNSFNNYYTAKKWQLMFPEGYSKTTYGSPEG